MPKDTRPLPGDVYFQTTDFTCGPAALMMALAGLDPAYRPGRLEELSIWREANIIFMGTGNAGCGPYGLARAAIRRGVNAEIFERDADGIFLPRTSTPDQEDIQRLVTGHDREEALRAGCKITPLDLTAEFIRAQLAAGRQLLALTGQDHDGHWVLVRDITTENKVTIVDPYKASGETLKNPLFTDKGLNTFSYTDFKKMLRYGPKQGTIILAFSRR